MNAVAHNDTRTTTTTNNPVAQGGQSSSQDIPAQQQTHRPVKGPEMLIISQDDDVVSDGDSAEWHQHSPSRTYVHKNYAVDGGDRSRTVPGHAPESEAILAQESAVILAQQLLDGVTTVVSVSVEIMLADDGGRSGPVPGHAPHQVARDTSTTAVVQATIVHASAVPTPVVHAPVVQPQLRKRQLHAHRTHNLSYIHPLSGRRICAYQLRRHQYKRSVRHQHYYRLVLIRTFRR
jgi:hypothetical protein